MDHLDHLAGKALKARSSALALALLLALAAALSAGCSPGAARSDGGSIRVHTTATRNDEALTVYLRSTDGQIVRQARGPGIGWDANFAGLPAGRYVVQLQVEEPSTSGSSGVVTSSATLTQAPFPVAVSQGSSTYLLFDGANWTAVQ